jgi:hypothetical protein
MRIWSFHPKYLDAKGLVALWRETLLAKHVLEGKTKGYKNHPQLHRFNDCEKPVDVINSYLDAVYKEAIRRNYNFDKTKFEVKRSKIKIKVNQGQLNYEFAHLLNKLKTRDDALYKKWKDLKPVDAHPLFTTVEGDVEEWEII